MNAVRTIDVTKAKKKKKTASFFGVLLAFVILYNIVPITAQLVSDYLSTYLYMALVVLVFAIVLLSGGMENLLKFLLLLLPFILYEALTFAFKTDTTVMWGYQVLLELLPVLIGFYLLKKNPTSIPFLQKVVFYLLVITALTSFWGLLRYPLAARALASLDTSSPMLRVYNYSNIGGYNFIYTLVLLYPILILAHKQKKIGRLPTLLGMVAIFVLVILSEYTTALLFVVFSSLFLIFKRTLKKWHILLIGLVSVLSFFLFASLISRLFLWLGNVIQSEVLSERLIALAGGRASLEVSEDKRLFFYGASLEAFLKSPLYGSIFQGYSGGGHSFLLDALANAGLLGGAVVFFIYRSIYRNFFLPYHNQSTFGYAFWAFVQAILLSLVNTGAWFWVLCCFIPIFLAWIYPPVEAPLEQPNPESTKGQQKSGNMPLPNSRPSLPRRRI